MFKDKLNYKLLNVLIIVLIVYIGLNTTGFWSMVINKILQITIPFILAFAVAYSLYPMVRALKKKGIGNKVAVAIVSTSVFVIIIGLLVITLPLIYEQLITLSKTLGGLIRDISSNTSVNLGGFETAINKTINNMLSVLGNYVSDGTFQFVSKSVGFIVNAMIVLIVSLYFLFDMENIRKEIKKLLKRNFKSDRMYNYIKLLDYELTQYLTGLAIFMAIEIVEYTLLFRIVGHPNWLLLGILASLTTVIPYFGGLFTNIAAVILASVVSTSVFIGTIIICLVFPQIDGYIVSPKVYSKTNKIHPVWSIFALVAGGILFGVMGIIISLPLYIVINTTIKFFKDDITNKFSKVKA